MFEEDGEVKRAVVAHDEGLVVCDELREQRDEKQRQEDPKRDVAPPVGAEIVEPAPGDGESATAPHLTRLEVDAGVDDDVHEIADQIHDEAEAA